MAFGEEPELAQRHPRMGRVGQIWDAGRDPAPSAFHWAGAELLVGQVASDL